MDNRKIDQDLRKATSIIRQKGLDIYEVLEDIQDHATEIDIELPESFEKWAVSQRNHPNQRNNPTYPNLPNRARGMKWQTQEVLRKA